MKHIFVMLSALFVASIAFGQEQETSNSGSGLSLLGSENRTLSFTSKNGHEVLPQQGDWAIGIDAVPMFEYMGNLFNADGDNDAPNADYANKSLPTVTIYGKYFVANDFAYRASVNIYADASTNNYRVNDDSSNNPDDAVFDKEKNSRYGATVSFGVESRRGSSRVQGVYGLEAYAHFTTNDTKKIEYGNNITTGNQSPSRTAFDNPITDLATPALGEYLVEANAANYWEVGVRAFVGVEYFIAPKVSLGAEFYIGAGYGREGEATLTYESYVASEGKAVEFSTVTEGNSDFNLGIDNTSGAINLMFYF